MREHDGKFLRIFADDFASAVQPSPFTIPSLNTKVHRLHIGALHY